MRLAAAFTSFMSLIYTREFGAGAKSKIFGGPVTTGTEPAHVKKNKQVEISHNIIRASK